MLRFVDSGDIYAAANFTQRWNTVNGAVTIVASRNGSGIKFTNITHLISRSFDSQSTWIVGFALRIAAITSGSTLIEFYETGGIQCALSMDSAGKLSIVRGSNTFLTNGTSAVGLTSNTWYYVEVKVTIADSIPANSCIIKLNGAEVANVAAGQDTKIKQLQLQAVLQLSLLALLM